MENEEKAKYIKNLGTINGNLIEENQNIKKSGKLKREEENLDEKLKSLGSKMENQIHLFSAMFLLTANSIFLGYMITVEFWPEWTRITISLMAIFGLVNGAVYLLKTKKDINELKVLGKW